MESGPFPAMARTMEYAIGMMLGAAGDAGVGGPNMKTERQHCKDDRADC